MKPQEKANELVKKFLPYVDWQDLQNDETNRDWALRNATKCALVTVEEMLKYIPTEVLDTYKGETNFIENEHFVYWQEVKKELKKKDFNLHFK